MSFKNNILQDSSLLFKNDIFFSTANKPKEKTPRIQKCIAELRDLKEQAAIFQKTLDKRCFNSSTDEPESLRLRFHELLIALNTLFDTCGY